MGSRGNEVYRNQFPEDQHDEGKGRYPNDVSKRNWARGGDLGGDGRPNFDHGKLDKCSSPKPPGGLEASGQDMQKSPFSRAHRVR
jgi:hypothetical protein